jgi:hypothetical protein
MMGKMSDAVFGGELFADHALARNTDPATSHAAARVVDKNIKGLMLVVYEAFVRAGKRGLTNTELVAATGLDWNTCTPRVAPLIDKGLIAVAKDSDGKEIRRLGGKGIQQQVRIVI